MPYSKLNILTELSANDVKFISVDRQKLDLSKYIYLWYRKFYICRDTARFYEHKNDPRIYSCLQNILSKIVSEYDQEIPQSQTADNPVAPRGNAIGKYHQITQNCK